MRGKCPPAVEPQPASPTQARGPAVPVLPPEPGTARVMDSGPSVLPPSRGEPPCLSRSRLARPPLRGPLGPRNSPGQGRQPREGSALALTRLQEDGHLLFR